MKTALLILLSFFCASANAQPYVFAEVRDSLSAGAGWQFSKHFGAEIAYVKDDKDINPPLSLSVSGTPVAPGVSMRQELTGARLSAIGRIPASESFSFLGSVSAYSLHGKLIGGATDASANGINYGFGIGASYAFNRNVDVRLMGDWMATKKDFFGAGADLDSMTTAAIAVLYRF